MAKKMEWGAEMEFFDDTVDGLTAPTYFFNGGKFQIESKDQIKKRLGKSQDLADALALTFSLPDAPAGMHDRLGAMKEKRRSVDYDPYAGI